MRKEFLSSKKAKTLDLTFFDRMAGGYEVHQVSGDVTVRYFKPKNPRTEPVAGGSRKTVAR